jgi:lysophospholipase
MLVFAAGADRVVSTPHIERFGNRLKAGRVIVLDHSEHEILQERDSIRQQFWAAFDAFIPGSAGEADALVRKAAAAQGR